MCNSKSLEFFGENKNLPILYEDSKLKVYKNPSGEIFIQSVLYSDICLRVEVLGNTITAIAHKGNLAPTSVGLLEAFRVKRPL